MKLQKKNFRVYLRALEPEDHALTHKWRSDEVYKEGVASLSRFVSLETEKEWLESVKENHKQLKEVRLAVVLKKSDQMVGMVYLNNINLINRNAVMGSLIGMDENRGKGYISEARYLIFEYGFFEVGLERISATILEDNANSRKSAEKFGYVKEGTLRKAIYKNGKFKNLIAYSMLKQEFMEKYLKNVS